MRESVRLEKVRDSLSRREFGKMSPAVVWRRRGGRLDSGEEGGEGVSAVFFQRRGAGRVRPWLPGAPPICILMPAWVLFFRLCWVSAEVCGLL